MEKKETITIETTLQVPVEKAWKYWTAPTHITQWNNASDDWHTPRAENDLRIGGNFSTRMEAKDGSEGFDFTGIYDDLQENKIISYSMSDGRKVHVHFEGDDHQTKITETFEAENSHPADVQKAGWQAILDNFKKYTETN